MKNILFLIACYEKKLFLIACCRKYLLFNQSLTVFFNPWIEFTKNHQFLNPWRNFCSYLQYLGPALWSSFDDSALWIAKTYCVFIMCGKNCLKTYVFLTSMFKNPLCFNHFCSHMRTPLAPNLHFYEILKMTSSVANCWSAIVAAICSIPILFGLLIKKAKSHFCNYLQYPRRFFHKWHKVDV